MKKFKKWILNNKKWSIVLGLLFILFIFLIFAVKDLFFSDDGNVYGSRLEGIENVTISNEKLTDIVNELEGKNNVISTIARVQGRIVYITIDVNKETSMGDAKNLADIALENFSKEEKEYYDFEFFLTQKEVSDSESYPTTGTKHKSVEKIVWAKSR